jgi:hypothetical protein
MAVHDPLQDWRKVEKSRVLFGIWTADSKHAHFLQASLIRLYNCIDEMLVTAGQPKKRKHACVNLQ